MIEAYVGCFSEICFDDSLRKGLVSRLASWVILSWKRFSITSISLIDRESLESKKEMKHDRQWREREAELPWIPQRNIREVSQKQQWNNTEVTESMPSFLDLKMSFLWFFSSSLQWCCQWLFFLLSLLFETLFLTIALIRQLLSQESASLVCLWLHCSGSLTS